MLKKGFNNWIEIFKGGKHRAMNGKTYDGDKIINGAIKTFDLSFHEPPVVLGHPTTDAPAYGWVKDLRSVVKNGVNFLEAKLADISPEFADAVKNGKFKKRSAKFYPNGQLRHVGFLGAMPPAVKGLKDISFADEEDGIVFEFAESSSWIIPGVFRRLREWMIEKYGKEEADKVVSNWQIKELETPEPETETAPAFSGAHEKELKMGWKDVFKKAVDELPDDLGTGQTKEGPAFSEADLAAAKKEAAETAAKEAREALAAEFAEKEEKARQKAVKQEIAEFVESGIKEGKILPAWKDGGLIEFMESLDSGDDSALEFAEGKDKKTPLDFFKGFLKALPKAIEFGEIAGRDKIPQGATAGDKLVNLAKLRAKKDSIEFGEALEAVSEENPELYQEYQNHE